MDGGIDVATLGLHVKMVDPNGVSASLKKVQQEGEQTAAKVASSFDRVVAASAESYRKMAAQANRAGALEKNAAFQRARENARAIADGMEMQFKEDQARLREDQARGLLTKKEAFEAGRLNAVAYNDGLLSAIDKGRAGGAFKGATGRAAFVELAGSIKNVTEEATKGGIGMSRLREGVTSFAASALHSAPGVAQLTSVMGSMALGSAVMVGVMAAAAAVGMAWNKLAEKARELRKDTDDAITALKELAKQRALGVAGDTPGQISAAQAELARKERELASAGPRFATASGGVDINAARRAALVAEIAELNRIIREGGKQVTETIRTSEAASLAALISSNKATGAERARARAIIAEDQKQLAALAKKAQTADTLAERAKVVGEIDQLTAALNRKTEAMKDAIKAETEEAKLLREMDAMTRDAAAQKEQDAQRAFELQSVANINIENQHRNAELLLSAAQISTQALQDQKDELEVYNRLTEAGLTLGDAVYAQKEREVRETIRMTRAVTDLVDAREKDAAAQKQAADQAEAEATRAAERTQRSIRQAFSTAFQNIFTDGIKGFTEMFEQVRRMGVKLASDLVAARISKKISTEMDAGTASVGVTGAVAGIAVLASAIIGAGKAAEAAAAHHRELTASLTSSLDAYRASVTGNDLEGQLLMARSQAAELRKLAMETYQASKREMADKTTLFWQEVEINELEAKRIEILKAEAEALKAANAEAVRRTEQDYAVRALRAQGYDEEADRIAFLIAQQRERDDAFRAGIDITTLVIAQAAELAEWEREITEARDAKAAEEAARAARELAAAEEEAKQKAQELTDAFVAAGAAMERSVRNIESLQARLLNATGNTAAGAALAFASGQRQELYDARAGGVSAAEYALLLSVQAFERQAFEVQQKIDAQTKVIQDAANVAQGQIQGEIDLNRALLDIAREQLRTAEQNLAATERVVDTLTKFAAGLSLGPLTTLSPTAKLEEARRQFDATTLLAKGGDKEAAGRLADMASTLLESSRDVNASGTRYVADFEMVRNTITAINAQYAHQLTTEQEILATLQNQTSYLEAQIVALQAAKEQAAADAAAQIAELKNIITATEQLGQIFSNPLNGNTISFPGHPEITGSFGPDGTFNFDTATLDTAQNTKSTVDELMAANQKLSVQNAVTANGMVSLGHKLDNQVAVTQGLAQLMSTMIETTASRS